MANTFWCQGVILCTPGAPHSVEQHWLARPDARLIAIKAAARAAPGGFVESAQ